MSQPSSIAPSSIAPTLSSTDPFALTMDDMNVEKDLEPASLVKASLVDEYDAPDTVIKKEEKVLPSPEAKTTKIIPIPTTIDESPILNPKVIGRVSTPRKSSTSSLTDLEPLPSINFKEVKGRPKIVLCSRCKTFVSRDKVDKHTKSKCDSIIKKRESNRGHCTCRRKRRVNPEFLKDFRRLKKENATAVSAAHAAVKRVSQIKKKMSKKKFKILPKDVKNLFSFLEKKFSK